MNTSTTYSYLSKFTEYRLGIGKFWFTLDDLKEKFSSHSDSALTSSLNRLSKKGKIVSIHKGFYLIITPDRMPKGILPPTLFIDSLMNYLNRTYYIGLLSASVYFGASHQQAQEDFIIINKPQIRVKNKKNLKINFVVKSKISPNGIVKMKTEAGFVNVSSAELTALDLLKYQNNIGGINRAVSVISELVEEINIDTLKNILNSEDVSTALIQRLGYIFDKLNKSELSNVVYESLENKHPFDVLLKSNSTGNGFPINKKWKIIENIELDLEF